MMDYAHVTDAKAQGRAKEDVRPLAIWVPSSMLIMVIVIGLVVCCLGYQNMTIARMEHAINMKKSRIEKLSTTEEILLVERAKLFNSRRLLREATGLEVAKSIQVSSH